MPELITDMSMITPYSSLSAPSSTIAGKSSSESPAPATSALAANDADAAANGADAAANGAGVTAKLSGAVPDNNVGALGFAANTSPAVVTGATATDVSKVAASGPSDNRIFFTATLFSKAMSVGTFGSTRDVVDKAFNIEVAEAGFRAGESVAAGRV